MRVVYKGKLAGTSPALRAGILNYTTHNEANGDTHVLVLAFDNKEAMEAALDPLEPQPDTLPVPDANPNQVPATATGYSDPVPVTEPTPWPTPVSEPEPGIVPEPQEDPDPSFDSHSLPDPGLDKPKRGR